LRIDWKLFGVHFGVHKLFEEGVMSLEEKFGGKFGFRVCEKKTGECFSIEEGKPKREIIRGDDSVLALISINYL
jgi:hypothetical protein